MRGYKQATFYGILNPYGQDVIEGNYCEIKMFDGSEIHGVLIDACAVAFTLSDCGEEKTYKYDDIKSITHVERND